MTKEPKLNIMIRVIIVVSAVILIGSVYMLVYFKTPTKSLATEVNQSQTDDAAIGGAFELVDHNGNMFNSSMLNGQMSLIYFGFTYCPDICPTMLYKLTEVTNILDKYNISIVPVFITIDPNRDNESTLKRYLANFHSKFIGLTGSSEQIKSVADKFKVYYARSNTTNSNHDHYMLDHSSFVYLLDKNGKYIKHFHLTSTPEEIIEFIRINKN